jgi:hypothetical protein
MAGIQDPDCLLSAPGRNGSAPGRNYWDSEPRFSASCAEAQRLYAGAQFTGMKTQFSLASAPGRHSLFQNGILRN